MTERERRERHSHDWAFKARFRRNAFGWRSGPAIQRVKEAVREIRKVARKDPVLAGEGAVLLLERVSPALERVDSSSGGIGTAVNRAIDELVPIIARASIDTATREAWLERLFEAHAADEIPYIESLADHWGELCASRELASAWADRLLDITRLALSPDRTVRGYFHGSTACLSALYRAGRYQEIVELVEADLIWPYKSWAVRALAATGRKADAIRYAEACRDPWTPDGQVDAICEEILLSSGFADEAYTRYGLRANRRSTYLATFRAVASKYPRKDGAQILADLVATTPGEEGKWFAAARHAGLYNEALALARRAPCDPRTLTRAARDLAEEEPAFALEAGVLALTWLVRGRGFDITSGDVLSAYRITMRAAQHAEALAATCERIREMLASEEKGDFVVRLLRRELALAGDSDGGFHTSPL